MKERSSDLIEKRIIRNILRGDYPVNSPLLPERELAEAYNAGRPTIREVLQRLEKDGWITIRPGMPSTINDYWKNGNLLTIVKMLESYDDIPDVFIKNMLELRISLSPSYIADAVSLQPVKVISLFSNIDELKDDATSVANFDWNLHKSLAGMSKNPIYLLILNSFKDVYLKAGEKYFSDENHRQVSRKFYNDFLESLLNRDVQHTELLTKDVMKKSLELWKEKNGEDENLEK
ncbi:GntR family transcriptional regulator [Rossellomorea vietnamensis]|uniref:GntR family transcriptional regulator n=1 Tax=Rossellomorea aquimaris TaxID=189382 RepID=A0A5D4TKR5_9BACI|nr:GntR family transcriptional regulator [Rossellomorea aquimaris]TYS75468.1 GntR family transcriptional regulator [Rossellomorea aquimaris]